MEITKICIKNADGVEVLITVEEAKKLYKALDEMFGKPSYTPCYPSYPVYYKDTTMTPLPQTWCQTSDTCLIEL